MMRLTIILYLIFGSPSLLAQTYNCTQKKLIRTIEIDYESPQAKVPCVVKYWKVTEEPGVVKTLWRAQGKEGYCEKKVTDFISKLESWGWSCLKN